MFRTMHKRRSIIAVAAAAFAVAAVSVVAANGASGTTVASFSLAPNPKFVKCLAEFPNDPSRPPTARVEVVKGDLNDRLTLHLAQHQAEPRVRPVHGPAQLARRRRPADHPGTELRARLVPVGRPGQR